jgi:acyl dehydratase
MRQVVDFNVLEVGDPLPPLTKDPITKVQLVRYAGASGDFNPLHTDDSVAQKGGMKGVIAQGVLIMGFMGQAISGWVRKRDVKRFKVRFMGMTYPGDVITVKASVKEKQETEKGLFVLCDMAAEDQNNEIKVSGQFETFAGTGT